MASSLIDATIVFLSAIDCSANESGAKALLESSRRVVGDSLYAPAHAPTRRDHRTIGQLTIKKGRVPRGGVYRLEDVIGVHLEGPVPGVRLVQRPAGDQCVVQSDAHGCSAPRQRPVSNPLPPLVRGGTSPVAATCSCSSLVAGFLSVAVSARRWSGSESEGMKCDAHHPLRARRGQFSRTS